MITISLFSACSTIPKGAVAVTSFEKEKGIGLCKNMNGIKAEIKNINKKFEDYKYKKVTEEQLEILKYNMENAEWISQKECENAN